MRHVKVSEFCNHKSYHFGSVKLAEIAAISREEDLKAAQANFARLKESADFREQELIDALAAAETIKNTAISEKIVAENLVIQGTIIPWWKYFLSFNFE